MVSQSDLRSVSNWDSKNQVNRHVKHVLLGFFCAVYLVMDIFMCSSLVIFRPFGVVAVVYTCLKALCGQ